MKTKSGLLLVFAIILYGCENVSAGISAESKAYIAQNMPQQQDEKIIIELNNGKKWKVDEAMMVHFRNMESDVNNFTGKTLAEYKTISEKLLKSIELLTSNCTMKGKAHDELHKWLIPYIGMVNDFSKAKDQSEAAPKLETIRSSFNTFNNYFQ